MIALFLLLLAVFVAGLATIHLLHPDAGYVLINIGPYLVETTAVTWVVAVLAGLGLLWLLIRLLRAAIGLPAALRTAIDRRRRDRAERAFETGLLALFEGHWARAEAALVKRAGDHRRPSLNYLAAARAAQRLGAPERRDHYLRLAALNGTDHDLATLLTQADLQRESGDHAGARQTALAIRQDHPQHPYAVALLAESEAALGDWAALRGLLQESTQTGALTPERHLHLERQALLALFGDAVGNADLARLKSLWESAGALRDDPALRLAYVDGLARLNADADARALIAKVLEDRWDGTLVQRYGDLHTSDAVSRLAPIEHWLSIWGERPELLQVAGRACLDARLWGKAQSYLNAALAVAPSPRVHLDLARCYGEMQQPDEAARHYRQGLELAVAPRQG